jgi:hypothetical protein
MSCTITVTGEGGKPLPNADVELWEVYPLARITAGRTDAGGAVTFSDLRAGTINPAAKDKSLPATHRPEAVVRVQAEGYVPALQSVRLVDRGRLPMELELTVTEWGNNGENIQPNWVVVGPKGTSLLSPAVSWTVDPLRPTKVTFTPANVPGVASLPAVSLDINADGNVDATLGQGQSQTLEFPAQGLYRVISFGAMGPVSARGEFWVQATGQPVREGVRVLIATPGEGELIDQIVPVRVTAMSYEGKVIRQVDLQVNGRSIGADYTLPCEFEVPWQTLAGGACTLTAVATDAVGKRETATRKATTASPWPPQR